MVLRQRPDQLEFRMSKSALIEAVADTGLTKKQSGEAVDAVFAAITKSLKKGESFTLVGFGTFSIRKRAARKGRNPQTGEAIKIKASRGVAFKAGAGLKKAI